MQDSQNSRRFAFRFEQPFFRKDTYGKPMRGVSNVRSLHIRNCRSAYKDNPEKTDLGGGYQQFACFQPNRWVQHASAISPLEVQKSPPRRGVSTVRMLQHPKIEITRVNFPKTAQTSSENQDQKNRPGETPSDRLSLSMCFQPNIWVGQLICCTLNTHNKTETHQKTDERTGQPFALFIAKRCRQPATFSRT
jgi:hypothetical protein